MELWLGLSLFFCLMSYVNNDPIKSCFFLIFTLLSVLPVMSFLNYVWFSYFVCMLFLSGIFVILVYFSSLSSFVSFFPYFFFIGFVISFVMCLVNLRWDSLKCVGLMNFYYEVNFILLSYLVMLLLFFMNFVSYYLSFSGALRSV